MGIMLYSFLGLTCCPITMFRREILLSILDKHCRDENQKADSLSCKSAFDFVYLPMDFMCVEATLIEASFAIYFLCFFLYICHSMCLISIQFWGFCPVGNVGMKAKQLIWDTRLWTLQMLLLHLSSSTLSINEYGKLLKTRKLVKSLWLIFRFISHVVFQISSPIFSGGGVVNSLVLIYLVCLALSFQFQLWFILIPSLCAGERGFKWEFQNQ